MKSAQIREQFLAYFEKRGHAIVPSASLVPAGDPTLLFTNAGMVQFKDLFLGKERRSYTRAATAQKCLRVSGKHNDLEEVGPSPQHHTFFEMLGNFSFGAYFKEEAIAFAWEFLTKDLGLPPDRLHPTVFEEDDESPRFWTKVAGIADSDIVRLGAEHNFWAMGETGPCGPNSEIIYDRTGTCRRDGSACPLTCDCGRWWELWNLVFMQFDRAADGALTPLGQPGVDTGMGLERLTAIMQGVATNYETDLFLPLIDRVRELTGESGEIAPERLPSYRAVADHARAMTFLIADGVLPSNEGRGYVLRRVLRRASYHGRLLGLERPFLSKICGGVIDAMGSAYPELREHERRVLEVVSEEEERFLTTLEAGLTRLEQIIHAMEATTGVAPKGRVLPGAEAFKLYDTYGFPVDLTKKILEARGWSLDEWGFEKALETQRDRAREAAEWQRGLEQPLLNAVDRLDPTAFVGYQTLTADAELLVLFTDEGRRRSAEGGHTAYAVLYRETPFYAEGGGQVGDRGRIVGPKGEVAVENVRAVAHGVYVHSGRVVRGRISEGERVRAEVDETARRATMRNHTATHLLHRALRVVLGPQAKQAGSLVAPDRLRFDFFHNKPLTDEELRETERLVREQVLLDRPVRTEVMALQDALALGADAMFDEKYGEEARVVSVDDFSRELCGGTHCRVTGEIGPFFIVDQRSVGAGLRRIEAVTGFGAFEWMDARRQVAEQLAREYNVPVMELPERLRALQERARAQPRPVAVELPDPAELLERAERRNSTYLVVDWLDSADVATLRNFADEVRRRATSAAVVLGSVFDGKLNLVVTCTDDLVAQGMDASSIGREIGEAIGGGGGGRHDMATAGGDPARLDAALARARELLRAQPGG